MALRTRNLAQLFKVEAAEGQDASPTAADDAILVTNPERPAPDPTVIDNQSASGSLDTDAPIVGGMTFGWSTDVILKGSGAAGTPPEWGPALRACGFAEITQTAVPSTGSTSASGGTTSSFEIDTATNSEWSTTEGAYLGMPVELTGTPDGTVISFVTGYTLVGSTATVEVAHTFGSALGAVSAKILPNVTYAPASENIPSLTSYTYMDGLLYKVLGVRGSAQFTLTSGREARAQITWRGIFGGKEDAAVPGVALDPTREPIWKNGLMALDGRPIALQSVSLSTNANLVNPDDPNQVEGFASTIMTGRDIQGSLDPLTELVANYDPLARFRAGTEQRMAARLGATPGNRLGLTVPRGKYRNVNPTSRDDLAAEDIAFSAVGNDSGAFLTVF